MTICKGVGAAILALLLIGCSTEAVAPQCRAVEGGTYCVIGADGSTCTPLPDKTICDG